MLKITPQSYKIHCITNTEKLQFETRKNSSRNREEEECPKKQKHRMWGPVFFGFLAFGVN